MNTILKNTLRPTLKFYHANAKGTGSAIALELHPARGTRDGAMFAMVAPQKTPGNPHGPNPTYPTFDWNDSVTVKLGFTDLCQILQVLRGETERVNGGDGIRVIGRESDFLVVFEHLIEPVPGYKLIVSRFNRKTKIQTDRAFTFTASEALGLSEVITDSLKTVAFGSGFYDLSLDYAILMEAMAQAANEQAKDAEQTRRQESSDAAHNCYKNADPAAARQSVPATEKPAEKSASESAVPTEGEFADAYKKVIAAVGPDHAQEANAAFDAVQEGLPIPSEFIAEAECILGKDNKVVRHAKFLGDVSEAEQKVLAFYGEQHAKQVKDAFFRVRTNPCAVTAEEISCGAEVLGEDDPLVKFFRDLHKAG